MKFNNSRFFTLEHSQLPCENGRRTMKQSWRPRVITFITPTTIFGDLLRKIKQHIGYILIEEFCATSDEQLLAT